MRWLDEIEARFNATTAVSHMQSHWTLCLYASAVYATAIIVGRRYMNDRPKFNLRRPLFAWNLLLALFSAIGVWRVTVPLVVAIFISGWSEGVCLLDALYGQEGLWMYVFVLSKLPELVDTFFIVLRKQPLIFLHWYHHITVFCFCWWAYSTPHGQCRIFIAMNYFVHMVMYFYYAIRAQGLYRVPRHVNIAITALQIGQMCLGTWSVIDAGIRIHYGIPCAVKFEHVFWAALMYSSYLGLFVIFFYKTYVKKKKERPQKDDRDTHAHDSGPIPRIHST